MDQQQELLKAMDVDVTQQTVVSDQLPDLTPVGIVEAKPVQITEAKPVQADTHITDDVATAVLSPKRPEEPKPDDTNVDVKMDDAKAVETDPIKDSTDEEETAKLMIFGEDEAEAKEPFTEPEKKKARKEEEEEEEEEEVKEPPKKKKKVEEPVKKAQSSKSASKKKAHGGSSKSASKKKDPVVDDDTEPSRKQPGHGMIRAEYVRLQRAMDALARKRDQRLESSGGHARTSPCSILNDNLIEYYEDMLTIFERKFGRYMV